MNLSETGCSKVSELYPQVSRILLFVAFEEADAEAEPNYQQLIFTPDAAPAFRLDCSREDCAEGGFDYGSFIAELIRRGEERAHGRTACDGRRGSGEAEECCSLQSDYRIMVQYRVGGGHGV